MTKLRNILIKMFSLVFAVSAAFAIATIPQAKTVNAEDNNFKVNGTSIYTYDVEGESKVGLRFEAEFNKAWLDKYPAEKYNFGMIIAPTANFTAWDGKATPTANMEAVDGFNFVRIQNSALTAGEKFHAGILFDDDSLIGIVEDINAKNETVTTDEMVLEQLANLKENLFKQSYSAVAYMSYSDANKQFHYEYISRYDTSMRETAAKTYALGVAEDNEEYKALALPYLNVTEDDVYTQSAYVALTDNKLVVDSAENFEIKESKAHFLEICFFNERFLVD